MDISERVQRKSVVSNNPVTALKCSLYCEILCFKEFTTGMIPGYLVSLQLCTCCSLEQQLISFSQLLLICCCCCCDCFKNKKAMLSQRWLRDAPYNLPGALKILGSPWVYIRRCWANDRAVSFQDFQPMVLTHERHRWMDGRTHGRRTIARHRP